MITRTRMRTFAAAVVAFGVLAVACGGGGGGGGGGGAADIAKQSGRNIRPPEAVDPKATGLPGLVLNTNSPTWQRLVNAPEGAGAVVLYVQPGGPTARQRIARGYLLTGVNGEAVTNHEHAIALLRARPGTKQELKFLSNEGEERTVEIEAEAPKVRSVRPFIDQLVEGNPNDPVLRYIRATSGGGGTFEQNLGDVDKAIEVDSRFVEAIAHRASLLWDRRVAEADRARRQDLANQAIAGWRGALDIDPENVTALSVRAFAVSALGQGRDARRLAEEALKLDDQHPYGYYALSSAYIALKEEERALAAARAAVELNPYSVVYFRALARLFNILGRKDDCTKTADAMGPFLVQNNLSPDAEALRKLCD